MSVSVFAEISPKTRKTDVQNVLGIGMFGRREQSSGWVSSGVKESAGNSSAEFVGLCRWYVGQISYRVVYTLLWMPCREKKTTR